MYYCMVPGINPDSPVYKSLSLNVFILQHNNEGQTIIEQCLLSCVYETNTYDTVLRIDLSGIVTSGGNPPFSLD